MNVTATLPDVVRELREHRQSCVEDCLRCQLFDAYMAQDLKAIERIEAGTCVPSTYEMARVIRSEWGEAGWTARDVG